MKGYIEIYQGRITEENLIFSEGNMIVDGAGEHVTDIFTTLLVPSALLIAQTSSLGDFGIKAITLGAAQGSLGYTAYHPVPRPAKGLITTYFPDEGDKVYVTNSSGYTHQFYFTDSHRSGLAAGNYHSIAMKNDGSLVSWGADTDLFGSFIGQVSNTPGGNDFFQVAAGRYHSVALKSDGSLVSWGSDTDGQVSDTPTTSDFTHVAAGYSHSIALKSDGSLESWGNNDDDEVSDTPTTSDFTQVDGGSYYSVALRSDGTLVSWGRDIENQVSNTPTSNDFVQVAAGYSHSVALKSDGSLESWGGWGDNSQVTDTPTSNDFTQVAAGLGHSVALKSDGSLESWGMDSVNVVSDTPTTSDFTQVATGSSHSVALKSDGTLVSWGYFHNGEVSDTPTTSDFMPVPTGTGFYNTAEDSYGTYINNIDQATNQRWTRGRYWATQLTTAINSNSASSLEVSAIRMSAQSAGGDHTNADLPTTHPDFATDGTDIGVNRNVLLTQEITGVSGNRTIPVTNNPEDLRVYSFGENGLQVGKGISIESSGLVAIPPNPVDTTLQPASDAGPGKLGHFLNYYNFSGSYPSLDLYDIREYGCYLPSAGISFAGSSFGYTDDGSVVNDMSGVQTGDLNSASAINSEGYILESTVARASQTLVDASGGFIVSGIADVSATREVKYILTISYKDWKFLDYYYGGIGAIGLWTLDREATFLKYSNESETAGIDLYNVADISRNPVFKLFAKKVFLPGGLKIDETASNDDYMTITWGIKF